MADELINKHHEWLKIIKSVYDKHHANGAYQILFPEYRPDISRVLANYLSLSFFDYRKMTMLTEGWNASKISLDEMTSTLLRECAKSALLVHNIEALLATKSQHERQKWLADFFLIEWPNVIILPIAIYQADTVAHHSRICNLEKIHLPEQSLLMNLAM